MLEIFFVIHDPTTVNRQGADIGTQYRSVIFCHTAEQEAIAKQAIKQLETSGVFGSPIVTEVEKYQTFYPAEEHHRGYYRRNSSQSYCQAVITPKLAKLREKYLARLKR